LPPVALFIMFVCFMGEIGPIRSEEGSDNENWSYVSSCWKISYENQFMCHFCGTASRKLHEFHLSDGQIRNYEFLCEKRELEKKKKEHNAVSFKRNKNSFYGT
jgi:hypothetical protein